MILFMDSANRTALWSKENDNPGRICKLHMWQPKHFKDPEDKWPKLQAFSIYIYIYPGDPLIIRAAAQSGDQLWNSAVAWIAFSVLSHFGTDQACELNLLNKCSEYDSFYLTHKYKQTIHKDMTWLPGPLGISKTLNPENLKILKLLRTSP